MTLKKFIPLFILIIGLVLFFALGGGRYISYQVLSENYNQLKTFTLDHYFLSVLVFMLVYILVVAFSIPGAATIMTLLGGFVFGAWLSTVWVVFAATIGATITFVAVDTSLGSFLREKIDSKSMISKMRKGFSENAFNYMLTLRLLPIFPFFLINIAAGIIGIRLRTFFFGTLIGIIPGTFIYAWVGNGLGYTFEKGEKLNLGIIFEPQILFPIIGLALLSIIPVIVKKIRNRKRSSLQHLGEQS